MLAMGATEIAGIHAQSGRYLEAVKAYRSSIDGLEELGRRRGPPGPVLPGGGAGRLGRLDEASAEFDTVCPRWKPGDPDPRRRPRDHRP